MACSADSYQADDQKEYYSFPYYQLNCFHRIKLI